MKAIIFGATGKTGQHAWRAALERGHDVTVFVRSPSKIDSGDSQLRVVQGDVFDADAVSKAVADQDAAIICLGSVNLSDKTTLARGTSNVTGAMERGEGKRLIVLSAAGVDESWTQIGWMSRVLFKTMLRNVFADHQGQEAVVRSSSLDWTIARAAILKDGPASGDVTASNTAKVGKINRADVANFLVDQLADATYSRGVVSITS